MAKLVESRGLERRAAIGKLRGVNVVLARVLGVPLDGWRIVEYGTAAGPKRLGRSYNRRRLTDERKYYKAGSSL